MPNRILREELLESEPWLALKDNADRCAFVACLLTVDNFADMPAGPQRLIRLWRAFGIDTPEKAAKVKSELADQDLIRLYEVGGKPYLHVPRFRQECRYVGSPWPLSPWATSEEKERLAKKSHVKGGDSRAVTREPLPPVDEKTSKRKESNGSVNVACEKRVDVDVDVDVDVKPLGSVSVSRATVGKGAGKTVAASRATRLPPDWQLPEEWRAWAVKVHHLEPQHVVRISLSFRDYWISIPGAKGCKLDWAATWRNWIRKECERA